MIKYLIGECVESLIGCESFKADLKMSIFETLTRRGRSHIFLWITGSTPIIIGRF